MFGLARRAVLLTPTEDAFDHCAARLRYSVALVPRGASVDRALNVAKLLASTTEPKRQYGFGEGIRINVRGAKLQATWEYQYRDPPTKKTRTHTLGPASGWNAINLTQARDRRDLHWQAVKGNLAGLVVQGPQGSVATIARIAPAAVAGKSARVSATAIWASLKSGRPSRLSMSRPSRSMTCSTRSHVGTQKDFRQGPRQDRQRAQILQGARLDRDR